MSAFESGTTGKWEIRAALTFLLFASLASFITVLRGAANHRAYLVDSYYAFSGADGIRATGLPHIAWPQGPENKFFPGYAYALALVSFITGQKPVEAWRGLACAEFLAIPILGVFLFRQW